MSGALIIAVVVAVVACAAVAVVLRRARSTASEVGPRVSGAEGARRVAESRAAASLERLPHMALRIDGGTRLEQANRVARERFPFLAPGVLLLEAFGEHELSEQASAALADMTARQFEVRLFEDGRRTYRATIEPYTAGDAPEALVFLSDATEAVAYQELRSQFVANVSHELRTPLTGLRGLLEALGDPRMDSRTRTDFTTRATNETLRLEALISDILLLSELESTSGLPSRDRADLSHEVHLTADELAAQAEEQGVRLVVDAPAPVAIPLSEIMARTVARNLMENAVKYAGPGAVARVSVAREGDVVTLVVSDDGAGIPERHLNHVFERFYRADPSRSKRLGGTGLGLSIVKHIAERFGGRAEAASREGFGTTVTVTLPAAPDAGGLGEGYDSPSRPTGVEGP